MRRRDLESSPWRATLLLILLLCLCVAPADASQMRPLNLQQMSLRADRIFTGRCLDVRVDEDTQLGQPVTTVTMVVTRSAKGSIHGKVTFRLLGRQDARESDTGEVDGLPRFKPGEEVVLFLYGDSTRGLTSPVGFGQGKFTIKTDKQGRRLATNAFGNQRLLDNLDADSERRLGPAHARFRNRSDISPDDLLDMVRSLIAEDQP